MNKFPVAAGIRADCEEFLKRFQQTESVRFEEFTRIWNEMKFSSLLSAFEKDKLMFQFLEECFIIALSFCNAIHQFQCRTLGLYLLYGFYFKQTNKFKLKIRVTSKQWEELNAYIEKAIQESHHDIHFVFEMLKLDHAFLFVANVRELAPHYRDFGTTDIENSYALHSSFKDIIDEGYIDQLEFFHQNYVSMKKVVIQNETVQSINKDFLDTIKRVIKEFEDRRIAKLVSSKKRDPIVNTNSDIGQRRMALKSGLYKHVAKTGRSRRHRAVELDENLGNNPKKKKKTYEEPDQTDDFLDDSSENSSEVETRKKQKRRTIRKKDKSSFSKQKAKSPVKSNEKVSKGDETEKADTNVSNEQEEIEDLNMPTLTIDEKK